LILSISSCFLFLSFTYLLTLRKLKINTQPFSSTQYLLTIVTML
jgi:hypothetical protein